MSGFAEVKLPSGESVLVRMDEQAGTGPRDVSLADSIIQLGTLPYFTDTVRGVVASVKQALAAHRPDTVAVEFGVEINAKTGKVMSVLAEVGGKANVKITATWGSSLSQPTVPEQAETASGEQELLSGSGSHPEE